MYLMSHWARLTQLCLFIFITGFLLCHLILGDGVKWNFLAWRWNIIVGGKCISFFDGTFWPLLLQCKVVFEGCIWHICKIFIYCCCLGSPDSISEVFAVPLQRGKLLKCNVNAEIVWGGPVPGFRCLAWLQEAAVRFAFGHLEPHRSQLPGCWSSSVQWMQFPPAFLSSFLHSVGPCHLVF